MIRLQKNNFITQVLLVFSLLIFNSCEEFIEVNLDNKSITIFSPANNTVTSNFTQTFWWEEVKGAESYQLQIVKPDFTAIQQLIVDTTVSTTKFIYSLQPGTYQWRLRAKNGSSQTDYFTYNLTIDSTLDLSGQPVILSSPADNYYANSFSNTFTWQTMPNADSYILQILSGTTVINTQTSTALTSNYTFASQGEYQWRVFAQNSTSNSSYYTRTITIDTAKPNVPIPGFPLNDTLTADPIPFSWNNVETGISYQILISTDSTFASVTKDTITGDNFYDFYNASVGVYYFWKIRSVDNASNYSAYCTRKRVKRN